jgi:RNA polymerase sigma factor (sigma-70 family)
MAQDKITNEPSIETLVELAREDRRDALMELIQRIQDPIYRLALRIFYLPADAEKATQEILIKIITHLFSFKGESRFSTWYFRIATNHLLNTHKRRAEKWGYSFEMCEQSIEEALRMSGAERFETFEESPLAEDPQSS